MDHVLVTEHWIEWEIKDGTMCAVLVVATELPIEPLLPGDAEGLQNTVQTIAAGYDDRPIDRIRVIPLARHRS